MSFFKPLKILISLFALLSCRSRMRAVCSSFVLTGTTRRTQRLPLLPVSSCQLQRSRHPLRLSFPLLLSTVPNPPLPSPPPASFNNGDLVSLRSSDGNGNKDEERVTGIINEQWGGGWYSVELSNGTIVKRRRGDLCLVKSSATVSSTTVGGNAATRPSLFPSPSTTSDPIPTPRIIDLDALLASYTNDSTLRQRDRQQPHFDAATPSHEQLTQLSKIRRWILFTDLHCSPSTLPTTIEILNTICDTAATKQEQHGVLFLGDWWHHRCTIRITLLNAILSTLRTWDNVAPMILIPGNHDQVTLDGSEHGLAPLTNAYQFRDGPGIMILGSPHPVKFMEALFVPHIRRRDVIEAVLTSDVCHSSSSLAAGACRAVFVHADVTGASMNDLVVSTAFRMPVVPTS
mmetsp:Transcript_54376/g.65578  ORF Transcript_54376/g.65578 Transcript_54376/m.65578 type:complete len:402 (-) Transcript_54376:50-1255(-)